MMKTMPFLAAAALLATAALAAANDAPTVKFSVNGMVCAFCAQGIEKRLVKMPETGQLYINLARKIVAVEPKAGKAIDIDKVRHEITEAGYDVTKVEPVAQKVEAIRAAMKAQRQ
jgi:periplasmic mercuric ion binding protein